MYAYLGIQCKYPVHICALLINPLKNWFKSFQRQKQAAENLLNKEGEPQKEAEPEEEM